MTPILIASIVNIVFVVGAAFIAYRMAITYFIEYLKLIGLDRDSMMEFGKEMEKLDKELNEEMEKLDEDFDDPFEQVYSLTEEIKVLREEHKVAESNRAAADLDCNLDEIAESTGKHK